MTVCCGLSFFGFLRKNKEKKAEAERKLICGGKTERTDPNAPKQIESKEITGFYSSFYLDSRWSVNNSHRFRFSISADGEGRLNAFEELSGLKAPCDLELLKALQAVIDSEGLAAKNGVYRVTAGLPPEYTDCCLRVNYASGESLSFTVDNDPHGLWAVKIYDTFADWFREKVDDSLLPARETFM